MYFILIWTFLLSFTTSIAAPVDQQISHLPPKVYLQLLKSLPQPTPSLSTASREQATLANLWNLSERVPLPKDRVTDILKHIKKRDEVRKRNRWIQSSERDINNTVHLFISQAWLNRKENRAEPNDINISIRQQGLTGDFCSSDSDCQGSRTCEEGNSVLICVPSKLQFCTSDSDCVSGEFCLDSAQSDDFCASTTAGQGPPSSSSGSGGTSGGGSSSLGLTADFCSSDSDCQGSRTCEEGNSDLICVPSKLQFCTSDSDCVSGEFCLDSAQSDDFCASTTAGQGTPSSSSSSGGTDGGSSSSLGLTADFCSSDSDCQGSRTCEEGNSDLICVPSKLQFCTSDSDCVSGEFCFDSDQTDDFCVSSTAGQGGPSSSSSSGGTDGGGSSSLGLTADFCSSDSDCQGTRTCQEIDQVGLACVPLELQFCTSDSDCVSGEFCFDSDQTDDFCASTTAGQGGSSSPSSPGGTDGGGSSSPGLTGDFCSSDSDCQGTRTCQEIDQVGLACVPLELQICNSDSDCVSGEFCFDSDDFDDFCISTTAGQRDPSSPSGSGGTDEEESTSAEQEGTEPFPTDEPLAMTPPPSDSLEEEEVLSSSTDSGDIVDEESTTAGQEGMQSSFTDEPPVMTSPASDSSSSSSSTSEETNTDENNSDVRPSISPDQASEQENQDTSEPCIAVHSLQHLSHKQLVFRENLLANVLCDENHSCATPGHMVTYSGSSMMMKSYCELIGGCTRKVMFVNSPRYERGMEVASNSDGMVFTAFSARYETAAEERMLSFAVKVGL